MTRMLLACLLVLTLGFPELPRVTASGASPAGRSLVFDRSDLPGPGQAGVRDVFVCRAGACRNLTRFARRQHVYDSSLSADQSMVYVWHMATPPRRLSVYRSADGRLLSRFVPGFGGGLSWTGGDNLLHIFGCGTGCGAYRLYDIDGRLLRQDSFGIMDVSVDAGLIVTGPVYPGPNNALRLTDIDSAETVYDSRNPDDGNRLDVQVLEGISWSEDQVRIDYRDGRNSKKQVRFNLDSRRME